VLENTLTFTFLVQFGILGLATFRIARLLTEDQLTSPIRDRIWKKFPPSTQFGYLWTCMWCMSFWAALPLSIAFILVPVPTVLVCLPFALSAIAGIIHTHLEK
jgi:hypothetical protein